MEAYSQVEGFQNEEPLSELDSKPRREGKREQLGKYLHANSKKHFSDDPYTVDGEFYQIIQILRTTKLQQCNGSYYNDGKFCALGAIMREKYGWNGNFAFEPFRQQLITIVGNRARLSEIITLNDSYGKSFSEIADWLETIYVKNWG